MGAATAAALLLGALQLLVAHAAVTVTPLAASSSSLALQSCCGRAKYCATVPELRKDGHGLVAPILHVAVTDMQMVLVPATLEASACAASACAAVRNTGVGELAAAHAVGKLVVHEAAVHAAVPVAVN